jgi:glycosyltransferase involved in cell wall biosynthesis
MVYYAMSKSALTPDLSVIIPIYNEEDSVPHLLQELFAQMDQLDLKTEIVLIDDGSTDGTVAAIRAATKSHTVTLIELRKNFGKTYALQAGFQNSSGAILITMDADLQDDPTEIPALLAKIKEGYDLVSGWKKDRRDPISKTLPSFIYNRLLVRVLFGTTLHDINCGLKAYRREVVESLSLYGEMHRKIPLIAHAYGFRITEIPVKHRPRKYGHSKYTFFRVFVGLLDLLSVFVRFRFFEKPMQVFGSVGLGMLGVGGVGLVYLSLLWVMNVRPIGDRPLLLFSILFVIAGIQLLSFGLLAELLYGQRPVSKSFTIKRVSRLNAG